MVSESARKHRMGHSKEAILVRKPHQVSGDICLPCEVLDVFYIGSVYVTSFLSFKSSNVLSCSLTTVSS